MRSAIVSVSRNSALIPTVSLLREAASAGVQFVGKDKDTLSAAAARAAAASSRYGTSGDHKSDTGILFKALPHQGIGAVHTGGVRDGVSLCSVGVPVLDPSLQLVAGRGAKRRRGTSAEPPGVCLAGNDSAPLLRSNTAESGAVASRGWFELPAPKMTLELKRELLILRNRNYLDPTRRYKTSKEDKEKLPKYFSIGTVVEGAVEGGGSSHRLSRAERKPTLLASLQDDPVFNKYAERTMSQVRERAERGGVSAYREKKAKAGADWKKRREEFRAANPGKKTKSKKLY